MHGARGQVQKMIECGGGVGVDPLYSSIARRQGFGDSIFSSSLVWYDLENNVSRDLKTNNSNEFAILRLEVRNEVDSVHLHATAFA